MLFGGVRGLEAQFLCDLGYENDGMYSRYEVLVYAQLIATDKPDEKYWKPGTVYIVAGNGKFEDALIAQLTSLSKNVPEDMARALNPTSEGWAFEVNVVKGAQGSVQLTPTFGKNYPAAFAEIPENYVPLADQYVSDTVTSEDLVSIIEALKASRIEVGLDVGVDDAENAPSPSPAPKVEDGAIPDAAAAAAAALATANVTKTDAAVVVPDEAAVSGDWTGADHVARCIFHGDGAGEANILRP